MFLSSVLETKSEIEKENNAMGFSLSNLLCTETDTFFNENFNEKEEEQDYVSSSMTEEDDEYIHMICSKEKPPSSLTTIEEWIRCVRLDSIAWILRIRGLFGFQYQTAYLSVAYLDQFLSRRSIKRGNDWAIRLLSVACLCVAAKMEECTVPPLSDFFPVEEGDLYRFESSMIQKMELLVLSTLGWNMRLVTPFAYINCFVVKLCGDRLIMTSIVSKIIQIIMASMRDLNLMSHRPSVIAGAATLVALDTKSTEPDLELKINAHSPFPTGYPKMVDIVSCHDRMKELPNVENVMMSEHIVSPNLSLERFGGKRFSENYVISGLDNKRKRLVFKDCGPNYSIHDEKSLI